MESPQARITSLWEHPLKNTNHAQEKSYATCEPTQYSPARGQLL